jgi:hypothetical protein
MSAKHVGLLLFADIVGFGLASMALGRNIFHYFTLILLVEAGLLFLIGGAMDFTGSLAYRRLADHASGAEKPWSFGHYTQKQESTLAYVLAGVILMGVSLALAYPLN